MEKTFGKIVIVLGRKAGELKMQITLGEASQDGELRSFGQDVHKTPAWTVSIK